MERFVVGLAYMLTGILAAVACGCSPYTSKKDGGGSELNAKGFVAIGLCAVDIYHCAPQDFSELLIVSIVTFVMFVLFFYIIYGIMSLLKVSGDDKTDRHSKAFWVNAAISTVLSFLVYA